MAILQMQRTSICALKKDRKVILEKLQSMGVMEISSILEEDEAFFRINTVNERGSFEKAASSIDQALDILEQYAPEKKSMLSSLAGKNLVDKREYMSVIGNKEDLLKIAKRIQALDRERTEYKANIIKIENKIESLIPWVLLGIPLNYEGTEHMRVISGMLQGVHSAESVYDLLSEREIEIPVEVYVISVEQNTTYLSVVFLKRDNEQMEEALRGIGLSKPSVVSDKIPSVEKSELELEIEEIQNRINEIESDVKKLVSEKEGLRLLADYYRIRAEKYEVLGELPQSERVFLISGYVPKQDTENIKKALTEKYDCVVDIEGVDEEEDVPVLLKNNKFSSGAEGVLEAFGLPAKGEIDPTAIMSFFYVFLFGMMLSDAAYGVIVSCVCGILLYKFPRMEPGMKKSMQLFFWCGLSTLFWGVMFGGYFGDALNVISKTFFGHEVGIPALWFAPLNEPMKLLVYSMLFGVIHLFMGLGIKGYICLKDRKFMDFFCDVVLWYMLLIGLLIMLLPSEIFASIAQASIVFPEIVNVIGKWLAILGALGILLMSGRGRKNIGLRLALGAYDLYNISGWLSDVLSYSRLLALGLATGVIASVVNQMGSMGGKSVFGVIMFIFAFIFGHTFNLAINLLGAYVHTNRLQFVEFFGKFYEGGGRPFQPFKQNTKYADIKEE